MARIWRCGSFEFPLDRPIVMGILNVTPDSFSDGGSYVDEAAAVAAGVAMVESGAAIVDVGGESTRPGSSSPTVGEELSRVIGVVRALAARGICVSIDTRHEDIAREAVGAGASIINDVSGFDDPDMIAIAAASDAGLVVMHMKGEPGTMQVSPCYDEVVGEVAGYLAGRVSALVDAGVETERIAVDPGIGFGKTTAHNLELLRRLGELTELGVPIVLGASRKRFIGELTGVTEPRDRVAGSIAVAVDGVERGAFCVRVHDVPQTVQALRMVAAINDLEKP